MGFLVKKTGGFLVRFAGFLVTFLGGRFFGKNWVAPRVGGTDSHASVWPLELGIWIPKLRCSPQFGDMGTHTLVWPLNLGIRTPTLRCGPSSWG